MKRERTEKTPFKTIAIVLVELIFLQEQTIYFLMYDFLFSFFFKKKNSQSSVIWLLTELSAVSAALVSRPIRFKRRESVMVIFS